MVPFTVKGGTRMNIYVGNLSYEVTEEDLREAFEAYGEVVSINIIMDRYTGKPKGFGFVEISGKNKAYSAIEGLDGKELKGRSIKVNKAQPRSDGRRSGGNRGGGRQGGGRGFY